MDSLFIKKVFHIAPRRRQTLHREQRVAVPEEAVVPYAGDSWVFVVDGDRVERRVVEVGQREPGSVEILSGLAAGEVIVTSGQHRLSDEAKIEIHDDEASAGAGD